MQRGARQLAKLHVRQAINNVDRTIGAICKVRHAGLVLSSTQNEAIAVLLQSQAIAHDLLAGLHNDLSAHKRDVALADEFVKTLEQLAGVYEPLALAVV